MFVRRIAAGACALCLVVPTAASAMPGGPVFTGHVHHTTAVVATGDTKNDLHVQTYEQAIAGDTKGRLPRAIAPAPATSKPVSVAPAGRAKPAVAGDGSTDGWQIAALAEAGLIAVAALGAAAAMTSRSLRDAQPGV
jgi:hypothetical protein